MKFIAAIFAFIILQLNVVAQQTFSISGSVKNQKGDKIQSATVFIAGTQKTSMTNADGAFSFKDINAGNYTLVVNMLGYNSVKQNVSVKTRSEVIDVILADKAIVLNEVVIGAKKQSPRDLKTFTKFFLGERHDPRLCKILNPEILNFVHTDGMLTATTDDFLVIDNQYLGYRIKYLLKRFLVRKSDDQYSFDGSYTFEPLTGTTAQQQRWNQKRKEAYENSMMHFLRALYTGTTRKEGFLVYKSVEEDAVVLEPNVTDPQTFVTRVDSNFIEADIAPMVLVIHDKKKAAQTDIVSNRKPENYPNFIGLPQNFTLLRLTANVDSRGSVTHASRDYTFGYWPIFGLAHQLPFEYQPE